MIASSSILEGALQEVYGGNRCDGEIANIHQLGGLYGRCRDS